MKCLGLISSLLLTALLAFPQAGMAYEEDFSSDPNFTIYGGYVPEPEEIFEWAAGEELYRLYLKETTTPVMKYACSPEFEAIQNQSFHLQIDFEVFETSYGFPVAIRFMAYGDPISPGITIAHRGAHNPIVTVADGQNVYEPTNAFPVGVWHRVEIDYAECTQTANIRITEVVSGNIYAEWLDVPFDPPSISGGVIVKSCV